MFFLQVWEGLLCSSHSQIHRSMGRWEILPSKWFITRTPSIVFPSKSIVHLLSSAIFVFFSWTFTHFAPVAIPRRLYPTWWIIVPEQSVWSWLVYGFSLDTVHAAYMWLHRLRIPKEIIYYIQYMMTILSPRHPPLETPRSRLSTVGTRKTWRSCLTRSHPECVQVRLRWSFLGGLC